MNWFKRRIYKFYTFKQNNVFGRFIDGAGDLIVVEAYDERRAWRRMRRIGKGVIGFWDECSCCGKRWYLEGEGSSRPMYNDEYLEDMERSAYVSNVYIYYRDNSFTKLEL